MTKSQIIAEITRRVGDPNAIAYTDEVWGYFIESMYELIPSLTENEKRYLTTKINTYTNTDSQGYSYVGQKTMSDWNDLYGVSVDGYPAKSIDREELYKMKANNLYFPTAPESYYSFDGDKLLILTGMPSSTVQIELWYLFDPHTALDGLNDGEKVEINNSLIYKSIPLAANKLKLQIGLTM